MKKIIAIAIATIAIAATALIAVPALAKDSPVQLKTPVQTAIVVAQPEQVAAQPAPVVAQPAQVAATNSLYMGYGAAFCGGGLVLNDTVTLQRVAATLGITYDQLVQRLQNGETIAAIATAQKVALSKVVDTIVAAQTDMVNLMLKYGYITQEQATAIIADLRVRVEAALSTTTPATGYGPGYGCCGVAPAAANGLVPPCPGPAVPTPALPGYGPGRMGGGFSGGGCCGR